MSNKKPDTTSDSFYSDKVKELFPERAGEPYNPRWYRVLLFGERPALSKVKCENHVIECVQKYPLVKLMISALKSKGCDIDLRRNFSCEYCGPGVTGGFDIKKNQIVVCYNRIYQLGVMQGVIAHELLHMFDSCRAELDFDNLEHIACTEIRAANLMHCSILSGMLQGSVSPFAINQAHQICVKAKAAASLAAVKSHLSTEEALEVVDRVFKKCYNDLEPVGRRLRRNSTDMDRAYRERFHYGYA